MATNPDPRSMYPKSFPGEAKQGNPGYESEMANKPDHGETTYVGKGLLDGFATLITGADSGIGKAVAIAYAREGADVAISYLDSEQKDAEDTKQWVEKAGRRCLLLPGDIGKEAHCKDLVERTVQEFGRLDVLVNNAATQVLNKGADDLADGVEETFRVNVFAQFWLAQAAAKHMQPGAAIINTTSVQAKVATKSMVVYAATKGAIASLTIGLSNLLVEKGIRVNCVAPGPIWTPFQPAGKGPDKTEDLGQEEAPLGRAGQPAELAPAYVLLASREGSYMTGALVPVTGGTPML